MAQFQTLYTGRDSAVKLPDLDKLMESQRRVGEMAIKGEEAKLSKRLSDQAKTAEMLKTNPVPLIADRNRTSQALMIEEFNNKWGAKAAETEGELSFADQLEMQRDKDFMTSRQQQLQVDEQRYRESEQMLHRDTRGFYDKKRWEEATQEFYETGVLPQDALIARAKDVRSALANANTSFTVETVAEQIEGIDGSYMRDVTTNMTEDEARRYVADFVMSDEGFLRYAIEDFLSQSEEIQAQYLDVDGDGVVDPSERQAVNDVSDLNSPIIRWAQQEYASYARRTTEGKPIRIISNTPPSTSPGGFDPKQGVSPTNNKNYEFRETGGGMPVGEYKFDSWVNLKKTSSEGIRQISKAERADGGELNIPSSIGLQFEMLGYVPSEDKIVVQLTHAHKATGGSSYIPAGTQLILDGEAHDDLLRRGLDIDRTAYGSFKGATSSPQMTFPEWKMQNPNGTAADYQKLTGR